MYIIAFDSKRHLCSLQLSLFIVEFQWPEFFIMHAFQLHTSPVTSLKTIKYVTLGPMVGLLLHDYYTCMLRLVYVSVACVCMCVHVCACVYVCACVHACVCVSMCVCV